MLFWLGSYLQLLGFHYVYFILILSLRFIRAAQRSFCLQLDQLLLGLTIATIELDSELAFGRISIAGGEKRLGCHGEVEVVEIVKVVISDPFLDIFERIILSSKLKRLQVIDGAC